ncbi:helix-turn-helix domain-containing protein [Nocardioides sp. NPDC127503]|uniref:helix-turn-helix domain-containing protein n=1 Tax=Nocardioides sp. NPDC127503 TaxID=3154516 RepID=UPI0033264B19
MPQPNVHWLTARQVAEHYAVSLRTVDRWAERGVLRAYRIGSVRRFKATEVVALPRRQAAVR